MDSLEIVVMRSDGTRRDEGAFPRLSVLIATYNAAVTLDRCLQSVFGQRDVQIEVLIADGGSSDDTLDILKKYESKLAFFTSEADRGVYDAWNKLVSIARGSWVIFLGADDIFSNDFSLRDALNEIECFEDDVDIGYVYGQVELVDGEQVIETFGVQNWPSDSSRLKLAWPFSHTGLFHRRELFIRYGLFDFSYKIAGDFEFVTRSLLDGSVKIAKMEVAVAKMAAGGMSTSARSRVKGYGEVLRARRQFGLRPPVPGWLFALLFKSYAAYYLQRIAGRRTLLLVSNAYRMVRNRKRRMSYN